MIYPVPDKRAVQFTFWRRKFQFRWQEDHDDRDQAARSGTPRGDR
jgi:hypothetical protein